MSPVFKKSIQEGDIIKFNITDGFTKKITNFYKIEPFPQYSESDNLNTILKKGNENDFAFRLKKYIGFNKKILEVGAGTCQLSVYLALGTNNNVYALDATYESLKLGKKFADKISLKNIKFVNADIFDDVFNDGVFDFIICNGVLHHTKNPKKGFEIITKYLKKNGYISIGLYNKIGRFRTHIRRVVYKVFGYRMICLMDPVLRNLKNLSKQQTISWIRDQYAHPLESGHTFDELKKWFDEKEIEFINSIPSPIFSNDENYFFKKIYFGTHVERLIKQFLMIFTRYGSEGGLYVFIGKKK